MKNFTLFIALAAITLSTNAKVLRVSNVTGSSAPYTNYYDAQNDAVDGDTIMFDGSKTPYCADGDTLKIKKRVTITGPGYFLTENGINNENGATANFNLIQTEVDGVVISGVVVTRRIVLNSNNNIITRNHVYDITFSRATTQNIIHQNYIKMAPSGDYWDSATYLQITNNIFAFGSDTNRLCYLDHATIKYNTFQQPFGFLRITNSTFEYNITPELDLSNNDGNTAINNHIIDGYKTYSGCQNDKDIYTIDSTINQGAYGAFAGEDPYVLSGIPAGPVIEDVEIPASIAKGKELNVTVKIGISK